METTVAAKKKLRAAVLARLKAKPNAQRVAESAALRARLSPLLSEREASSMRPLTIALYAPLPHEVDLMPLLQEYPQHRYLFPRCLPGRQLTFHYVQEPKRELVEGAHGILAPLPHLEQAEPEHLDLILVPGVAFTASGERLGYGGGYYDRYLPRCHNARLLALAFAEQVVDSIPSEPHDLRLPELIIQNATTG